MNKVVPINGRDGDIYAAENTPAALAVEAARRQGAVAVMAAVAAQQDADTAAKATAAARGLTGAEVLLEGTLRDAGLVVRHNTFVGRIEVQSATGGAWRELDDETLMRAWSLHQDKTKTKRGGGMAIGPFKQHLTVLAWANRVDPALELMLACRAERLAELADCKVRGMVAPSRLMSWVVDWFKVQLGAGNVAAVFGAYWLLALVARQVQPGAKFDAMLVIGSPEQGGGKSRGLRALVGKEFFTDAWHLGDSDKDRIDNVAGVMLVEVGELAGMNRADVEKVKARLSMQSDRGRASYGHFSKDRPRRYVFAGTTNQTEYLRDQTGNRRFLPVEMVPGAQVDLLAIREGRRLLFGEAMLLLERLQAKEAEKAKVAGRAPRDLDDLIQIPEKHWPDARAEQARRMVRNEALTDVLAGVIAAALDNATANTPVNGGLGATVGASGAHWILSCDLLRATGRAILSPALASELKAAMADLGYEPTVRRGVGGRSAVAQRGYAKGPASDLPRVPLLLAVP